MNKKRDPLWKIKLQNLREHEKTGCLKTRPVFHERACICQTVSSVNIYAQLRKLTKLLYVSLSSYSFRHIFAAGKEFRDQQ